MQSHVSATFANLDCNGGICVADGYGIGVTVRRGHLVVEDGIGRYRRERSFARATAAIKRLVILGHSGIVTLEALKWMTDVGISFVHIDTDGTLLTMSAPCAVGDARIRRVQALAPSNGIGLEITRQLLHDKLSGQMAVLARVADSDEAKAKIEAALHDLEETDDFASLRLVEAAAALAYWGAWAGVPARFGKADLRKLPRHWLMFGQRSSPLSGSPRLAANPANAILNYLYAILEAEVRIACLAVGLDPALGILHADQQARDSLVLDLMEPIRPSVDEYVLEMLSAHTFRYSDFAETKKGVCRLLSPLTHRLAETAPAWAKAAAPVVERTARLLAGASSARRSTRVATPLTQTNRSAGRDGVRRKPVSVAKSKPPQLFATCRGCGEPLPSAERVYCDECLSERRKEAVKGYQTAGPAALSRRRAEGNDPAHGGQAAKKRGTSNAKRVREAKMWEAENERPDPSVFVETILPSIQGVSLSRLMDVTGLSLRYCSLIRRGAYVPHPKHWDNLRCLRLQL